MTKYLAKKWFPEIDDIEKTNKESSEISERTRPLFRQLYARHHTECPEDIAEYFYQFSEELQNHGDISKEIDFTSEPRRMAQTQKAHLEVQKERAKDLERILEAGPKSPCERLREYLNRGRSQDTHGRQT